MMHWIEQWLTGNREPDWQRLVSQYGGYVWTVAYNAIGDTSLADDCCQEAWRRIVGAFNRHRWQGENEFKGWLAQITRNVASTLKKQLNGRREVGWVSARDDADGTEPEASDAERPERAAERAEENAKLRQAMQQLPERERDVIHLEYFLGYSRAKTADELDLPVHVVRHTEWKALKRLRCVLALQSWPPDVDVRSRDVLRCRLVRETSIPATLNKLGLKRPEYDKLWDEGQAILQSLLDHLNHQPW